MKTKNNKRFGERFGTVSRRNIRARRAILAAIGGLALSAVAPTSTTHAATYFLDNNGVTSGLGSGVVTWDASTPNWSSSSGGTDPAAWVAGSVASVANFTVTVSGQQSVGGLILAGGGNSGTTANFNIASSGSGAFLIGSNDINNNPFTITQSTNTKQIIAVPIIGSGDMVINGGISNPANVDIAADLSQFTGNLYLRNDLGTNGVLLQLDSPLGDPTKTIYMDQKAQITNNNQVPGPGTPGGTATPNIFTLQNNIVLNYLGQGTSTTNTIGCSAGPSGFAKIENYAGNISSGGGPSVITNVILGGPNGTIMLSGNNTWTGTTQINLQQGSTNHGFFMIGSDTALPATTTLLFGNAALSTAPMNVNGHNITIAALSTNTTNTTSPGVGNIYNLTINNPGAGFVQNAAGAASTITLTPASTTSTTYKGDIGSTNLQIHPLDDNSPYQGFTTANTNISLVLNGPTGGGTNTLTLAPIANLVNGNEYTGSTTINSNAVLVLGRVNSYSGTPGAGYTVNGAGGASNCIVNNGGTLTSSPPSGAGNNSANQYAGGFSGNTTLNSGAALNPGGNGATGTISSGGMTINAGATLNFDIGSNASLLDAVFLANGLTLGTSGNSTLNLALTSGVTSVTPGTYNLITAAGGVTWDNTHMPVLGTTPSGTGETFQLGVTANALQLTVLASVYQWDASQAGYPAQEGAGTWTDGTTKFVNLGDVNHPQVPWSNSSVADVLIGNSAAGAGGQIDLGTNITVNGKLTFGPIFPTLNYVIAPNGGHTLTLGGGINVNNLATTGTISGFTPSAEIDAPIILSNSQTWSVDAGQILDIKGTVTGATSTLTKTGAGTVFFETAGGNIGALNANQGIVVLGATTAIGNAAITLNGGGVEFFNLSGNLPGNLTIGPNGGQVGTTNGTLTVPQNVTTTAAFGCIGGANSTVVLSGSNSIGTLDIFGGTLAVSSAANLGNPNFIDVGAIASGGGTLSSSVPLVLNGVVQGAGGLGLAGPEFTLAGANTITGPISLNQSGMTVHVTNVSGLGNAAPLLVNADGTLDVQQNVTAGALRSPTISTTLHKTGTGVLTLSGTNTASTMAGSTLVIDAGTVRLTTNTAAGAGGSGVNHNIVVNSGGTLSAAWGGNSRTGGSYTFNNATFVREDGITGETTIAANDATDVLTFSGNSVIRDNDTDTSNTNKIFGITNPILVTTGSTLTVQMDAATGFPGNHAIDFRGPTSIGTNAYNNITLQAGASINQVGAGELRLGRIGSQGIPIIGQGSSPSADSVMRLQADCFLNDKTGSGQIVTAFVINSTAGSGAGLRVEAAMNAVYPASPAPEAPVGTTGLFGENPTSNSSYNTNHSGYTVFAASRAAALSAPLTLPSGTITPAGQLTLAANNTSDATGLIQYGPAAACAVALGLDNAAASANSNLVYQIDGVGSLGAIANFAGLNVKRSNAGTGSVKAQIISTTRIPQVSVSGGAKIDLQDQKLILGNQPVGTATAGVYNGASALLQSGRNGGGWNGSGIMTSQAPAATGFTSIGIATGQQVKGLANPGDTATWGGVTVSGSDTLVMYTYGGDANLDGKINVDDYGRIDSSIPLGIAGWYNGDFNYDGKINVDDYGIIDSNIGIQGAPFPTATGGGGASLSAVSAVPEPTSLGLVAAGLTLLARRRSRRRSPQIM